tara:strand:- start:1894 stop:2637 length:744 start_codon:yes stop_codon:yes gene_type:complete
MKKKYIIIGVVVAIIAFFAMCGKAEAQEVEQEKTWQVDVTTGYYEKRISGGLYGAQDVGYIKASTKAGDFAGLSFVGGLEYVHSDVYQLHYSLGTYINTPVGGIDTRVVMHTIEGADTSFELNGTYDLNWFKSLDTSITVAAEDGSEVGSEYDSTIFATAFNVSKTFTVAEKVDVTVGGEYGQSFGLNDELEYTLGYVRFDTLANKLPVFVQVNALRNNLGVVNGISSEGTDGDFDVSVTAGVAFNF